jgi:hypothetical protein
MRRTRPPTPTPARETSSHALSDSRPNPAKPGHATHKRCDEWPPRGRKPAIRSAGNKPGVVP